MNKMTTNIWLVIDPSTVGEPGVYISLFCGGAVAFAVLALTTLPVDTAIQHPVVRGLAEGMAVTGWLLLATNNMFGSYFGGLDSIFYKIASLWFYSSPLWILLVLWNNMERKILLVLSAQYQFWVVHMLVLWTIVLALLKAHREELY